MTQQIKIKDLFYGAVAEKIRPALKGLGFTCKKNKAWNRGRSVFFDVIEIDVDSKTATTDSFSFTVNCGIVVPDVNEIIWDKKYGSFFAEVDGIIRARAGEIVADVFSEAGRKKSAPGMWWDVTSFEDIDKVIDEIFLLTTKGAIQFFSRFDSLNSIESFLSCQDDLNHSYPLPKLQLAVLRVLIGKNKEGRELLQKAIDTEKGLPSWSLEVLHRIEERGLL
jgi:hypothetical protein